MSRQLMRAAALLGVLAGAVLWSVCSALELRAGDLAGREYWGDLKYVGVVLLRQRVSMDTYGALPPTNFLAGITSAENRFTVVGYGMQGLIKPFLEDRFERFQGQVKLLELKSTTNGGQSAKFTNNPGTGGGTCFGDSGGPVFYDSSNMVVAVVSFGITPCIGVDYQFRVDKPIALSFLRQYIR